METLNQITGKVHSFESGGTVDGPGIRYVVFMQGCPLRCQYCHNPDTWLSKDGQTVTAKEVLQEILKYEDFMKFSGGGVTFSGGEPLLQKQFLIKIFEFLKRRKIHTAIDTSGYADIDADTEKLLSMTDMVLLDVKHLLPTEHKNLTGMTNDKTLAFLKFLKEKNIRTWVRWVVLPGFNDTPAYAENFADFIKQYPNVELVELLPYHENGKYKWKALGLTYKLEGTPEPAKAQIKELADILKNKGVKTLYAQ